MKKGISQEGLKLIACITMLIDHIGYKIIYNLYLNASIITGTEVITANMGQTVRNFRILYETCRSIGRISLPIFAFLLVEGIHRTRNKKQYALRLAIGALLSEIPYNLIVSGQIFWREQSIMLTLLLGFLMVLTMERCRTVSLKPLVVVPFAIVGELMKVDYGWQGIALIALFEFSRFAWRKNTIRFGGMLVLFHTMDTKMFWIGNISIPMQALGALSMLFISNYNGRKLSHSKAIQWGFYLFYPIHLLIIWAIGCLIPAGYPL